MRISRGEENSHAFTDEFGHSPEGVFTPELTAAEELTAHEERFIADENFEPDKKGKSSKPRAGKGKSSFSQYLSMIAITLTGTAVLTAPLITNSPTASLLAEDIGLETYSCQITLENADDEELFAVLSEAGGELIYEAALEAESLNELSFGELSPDTEYTLAVSRRSGEKYIEHSFKTEPFVSFGEEENGKIPFYLHEDLKMSEGMDIGVRLYSSSACDFSSNIYLDMELGNFIITNGLYRDSYSFILESFGNEEGDGAKTYSNSLELGKLEKPEFNISLIGDGIVFEHISGELGPYKEFEIEISNGESFHIFYGEDVTVENSLIRVALTEYIAAGNYTVSVWGSVEVDGIYLYNQIYTSEIIM